MALALVAWLVLGCWAATARALPARPAEAQLCDRAAAAAARRSGVPLDVLLAITRSETGRSNGKELEPWPWTVNMEGAGVWFDTEDEARAFVFKHFKRGARSFDVGCFQINYKWHGAAFGSIDEMFDPEINADYAARFLAELYAETGDWSQAAGAYHSRTPEYATRYAERFDRIRARTGGAEILPAHVDAQDRAARFGPPRAIALDRPLAKGPLVALGGARPVPVLGSLMLPQDGARPAFVRLD